MKRLRASNLLGNIEPSRLTERAIEAVRIAATIAARKEAREWGESTDFETCDHCPRDVSGQKPVTQHDYQVAHGPEVQFTDDGRRVIVSLTVMRCRDCYVRKSVEAAIRRAESERR